MSILLTVNHKVLGLAYMYTGILFGMSGWIISIIMR